MARYKVQITARSCCGRHRWPLVDIVEALANSGFQQIALEEIAFAGVPVQLALPLEAGISGDRAHALVDIILDRLSQTLGSNAFCFTGNLTVTALVEAEEAQAPVSLAFIKGKALSVNLEPLYLHVS
jgi:hypothetical protein